MDKRKTLKSKVGFLEKCCVYFKSRKMGHGKKSFGSWSSGSSDSSSSSSSSCSRSSWSSSSSGCCKKRCCRPRKGCGKLRHMQYPIFGSGIYSVPGSLTWGTGAWASTAGPWRGGNCGYGGCCGGYYGGRRR